MIILLISYENGKTWCRIAFSPAFGTSARCDEDKAVFEILIHSSAISKVFSKIILNTTEEIKYIKLYGAH